MPRSRVRRMAVDFVRFRRENGLLAAISYFSRLLSGSEQPIAARVSGQLVWMRPKLADWRAAYQSLGSELSPVIDNFRPADGAVIIDAGGFIGTATMKLAQAFPRARIVTIEPSADNFALLQRNVSSLGNVHCVNAALSTGSGRAVLRDRQTGPWGYTIVTGDEVDTEAAPFAEVRTIGLPETLSETGAEEIFLLKMDIEGGEKILFQQSEVWLPKTQILFVELHERIVPGVTDLFNSISEDRCNLYPGGEKILSVRDENPADAVGAHERQHRADDDVGSASGCPTATRHARPSGTSPSAEGRRHVNIVYHYFPQFRERIFDALRRSGAQVRFIYGLPSRFGVHALRHEHDAVQRNVFVGTAVLQSFDTAVLRDVSSRDSIILGDAKFLNSWLYALIARAFGRRVYFWTHGILAPEGGLKWLMRKSYYRLADALLLYSDYEAQLLEANGLAKPLFVVGNSNFSDEEAANWAPRSSDDPAPGPGVCYIGRISQAKGLLDFVRLAEENPWLRVLLVGPVQAEDRKLCGDLPNLRLAPPEYDETRLAALTEGYDYFVMFSPAGLSLFTAALLDKVILLKSCRPQKPEYHILAKYGLVRDFDDRNGLVALIGREAKGSRRRAEARKRFLMENSAERVAERILSALKQTAGSAE